MLKTGGVVAAVLLLAACGAPKPREIRARPAPEAASPSPAPTGYGYYRIDATRSEVRLLVYRAGAMARLGHNHVIVNHAVGGWVKFSGEVSTASFSLSIPVAEFVIDETRSRADEGADFSATVPDDARAGTRRNMLSASLLDGDDFPMITLTSVAVEPAAVATPGRVTLGVPPTSGTGMPGMVTLNAALSPGTATPGTATFTARMVLRLAGHESMLLVPFTLEISAGQVSASGSVVLRQTAMGLVPFSVMLGALQVQDELTVIFKLLAAN